MNRAQVLGLAAYLLIAGGFLLMVLGRLAS